MKSRETLSNRQALYFLWATILNQSQKADMVLDKTLQLFERLNLLDCFDEFYPLLTFEKILNAVTLKPAAHRFPLNMSNSLYFSTEYIRENYSGQPSLIFQNFFEIPELRDRLLAFRGIGDHKADTAIIVFENFLKGSNFFIEQNNCASLFFTLDKEVDILNKLRGVAST